MNDSKLIDHTLLAAKATQPQIEQLCREAVEHDFYSICVNPTWVEFAAQRLADSGVKVCTVIGFPLGANTPTMKALETADAVRNGAHEVDMVLNIGWAKNGEWDKVQQDMIGVVQAAGKDTIVKVILETCLLTDDEIRQACACAIAAKVDFVKTSTGFSTSGATVEAVKLMRECVGDKLGVKASGGIRTAQDMADMVAAGATRIGASAGAVLLDNMDNAKNENDEIEIDISEY
ncbi:deoxyribose-phosphate aldolase [Wielerella bovis]|uniref:deoxyribose-phosphate aldolase n=1 Tax=Wielerella bovis TaxID=2917790 RepID=UPI002018E4E2|nr:deoxyribose-phosphate aldolase [Wielerella bovis]ULJ70239.1 deoxyribose-phosphate aldolase [Wielerella bovis]